MNRISKGWICILIVLSAACTTPYSINHWVNPGETIAVPDGIYGSWTWVTDSGGVSKDNELVLAQMDPDFFTGSGLFPNTMYAELRIKSEHNSKTDTLKYNVVLFKAEGETFVELTRAIGNVTLAEQLNDADIFYMEKKYIVRLITASKDSIRYADISAEKLKQAVQSSGWPVYFMDNFDKDPCLFGNTTALHAALGEYVKRHYFVNEQQYKLIRTTSITKP
ncbi:MAG TPA: hypothetical protein VFW78_03740 [Bacteroidia bacterium]|nr:hypothetical protein [Bacteroidia bacterium]